jgi:DNA/RNA-binding domain of Phe-tRNA-synthetase-like protein
LRGLSLLAGTVPSRGDCPRAQGLRTVPDECVPGFLRTHLPAAELPAPEEPRCGRLLQYNRPVFTRAADLASIVCPALLWWEGARVVDREPCLDALLAAAAERVRAHPPEDAAAVRTMYKRIGLDPTKTRPSNEALLRRVRKGDPLPRVNSLVDIINWCSVEFQLPYGLYDRQHIRGPITLRLGHDGEEYAGIRKDTVHVAGRMTLADDDGPFGNPTSDSARTMVTPLTRDALVVVFAPASIERGRLAMVLDTTAARMQDIAGGNESNRMICT